MTATGTPWLICPRADPAATRRVYCFPHSGGAPGEYLRLLAGVRELLPGTEIWGVQLPAHGGRLADDPLSTMDELIPALLAQANFRPPYAFLGHSLGALIAFETARALRERGLPGPDLLHVSGTGAPHLQDPDRGIHELPSEQLLDVMQRRYGAVPPEIRADPELIELILPGLRADLAVVATYRHRPGEPLDCPLLITGGTADDSVTEQALAAWSAYTTAGSTLRMFPGDHFYLREAPGFGPLLAENLRAALP